MLRLLNGGNRFLPKPTLQEMLVSVVWVGLVRSQCKFSADKKYLLTYSDYSDSVIMNNTSTDLL